MHHDPLLHNCRLRVFKPSDGSHMVADGLGHASAAKNSNSLSSLAIGYNLLPFAGSHQRRQQGPPSTQPASFKLGSTGSSNANRKCRASSFEQHASGGILAGTNGWLAFLAAYEGGTYTECSASQDREASLLTRQAQLKIQSKHPPITPCPWPVLRAQSSLCISRWNK